ncbi:MAG: flagellin [Pirellulales bacterium]|nr:flagellin [Pirellulales bacterium]
MTRINTNVSSLVAQKTLTRSNSDLQSALTRLSTGLRINKGKDDPAGLIASELLRSDITSVQKAITNSERANQVIGTADSALGQVSALLNDIRGLVSESANTGALSDEQVEANQLQVDSSLEAIDRIAQITSFQGRRLLDGSLDFITSSVDTSKINDLKIDQANFGTLTTIGVSVNVEKQATKAELNYGFSAIASDLVLELGGKNGTEAFNFASGSTIADIAAAVNLVSDATGVQAELESAATPGSATISSFGSNNDIVLTSKTAGFDPGNIRVKYTTSDTPGGSLTATFTNGTSSDDPDTLNIQLATQAYVAASATFDRAGTNNTFTITSKVKGDFFNGLDIRFVDGGAPAAGNETFVYDPTLGSNGRLTITIDDGATTVNGLIAALAAPANAAANALFTITDPADSTGAGTLDAAVGGTSYGTLAGGIDGGAVTSTASDIVSLLNNTAAVNARLTAALADDNTGSTVASAFQEFAYFGQAEANNRLQFLGPEGSRNVRFVANAGQTLGIDLTTDPQVTDFATATTKAVNANASLTFTARTKGSEFDGVTIRYTNGGTNTVVYDPEGKTLTFDVTHGVTTAANIKTILDSDAYASQFFTVSYTGNSNGSGVITANDDAAANRAVTSGGVSSEGTLIVNLETDANGLVKTTANDLIDFFNAPANASALSGLGISVSNAGGSDGTGLLSATTSDLAFATSGTQLEDANASVTIDAVNGINARLTFTAVQSGKAFDGVRVLFEDTATSGNETVVYDEDQKTLTFSIESGVTDATAVRNLLNNDATANQFFTAAFVTGGGGAANDTLTTFDGGATSGGQVDNGSEDGVALIGNSDSTNTGLKLVSSEYGSDAFVSVKVLNGAAFSLKDSTGAISTSGRSNGTDVQARVNGIKAVGSGLRASINTTSLDLTFTLSTTVIDNTTLDFSVIGGGARFQIGPDVVSNQQARLGIRAVSTARLGGPSGKLFELRSGGTKSLSSDATSAASVVEEAIKEITQLRGRLGAFQRTTLETNIFTLNDTLENLTEAESSIRDADFAAESAKLTRAQILVQSGTSVLAIANQNPQNVLSLLR